MLTVHKQIDKRPTMKNQNSSATLGRPAIKLRGGGGLQLLCGRPTLALSSEKINRGGAGAGRWSGDWALGSPAELQLTIRDTDRLSGNKCSSYSKRYKSI